jgi:hypothetical protein
MLAEERKSPGALIARNASRPNHRLGRSFACLRTLPTKTANESATFSASGLALRILVFVINECLTLCKFLPSRVGS